MYKSAYNGPECDAVETRCKRVDIRIEIQNSIEYLEKSLKETQERLRVEKEKLRLVNKNKDLEAYLNLTR